MNKQVDSQGERRAFEMPLIAWGALIFAIALFLGLSALFHHEQVVLWLAILWWAIVGMAAMALAYLIYSKWHQGILERQERKIARQAPVQAELKTEALVLKNEMLRTQIAVLKQAPAAIRYAIDAGHNVEIDKAGSVKITSYLSNVHTLGGIEQARNAGLLPSADSHIPPPFAFSDVLTSWQPSKDGILLARKDENILVPIGESLCHTTFTGNTDAGKTNDERMLLIQLLFLQQCVYVADRNYQTFRQDKKTGAVYDYRPIEDRLAHPPIYDTGQALRLLQHLYSVVESRRTERRKVQSAGALVSFRDIYLVMDELPAFAHEEPEIMDYVGRLVREARQYGVFFIGAAQDLLNKTLNSDNGAIRENLLTNFYGGGDLTTARVVLNLARGETIDESGLGVKGVKYLRAKGAGIERAKVRVPLSDDKATHLLLPGYEQVTYERAPVTDTNAAPFIDGRYYQREQAERISEIEREQEQEPETDHVVIEGSAAPAPDRAAPMDDLQRVASAWNAGHRSIDKVMAATGIGQNRSRVLINQAKSKGLIQD